MSEFDFPIQVYFHAQFPTTHDLPRFHQLDIGIKECHGAVAIFTCERSIGMPRRCPSGYARSAPQFPLCLHFGRPDRLNAKTRSSNLYYQNFKFILVELGSTGHFERAQTSGQLLARKWRHAYEAMDAPFML